MIFVKALRHDMKPPPRSAQRACPFEELVLLEGFVCRTALLRGLAGVLVRGKGRLNLDGGEPRENEGGRQDVGGGSCA